MRELVRDALDKYNNEFSPLQRVGWICVMGATAIRPFLTAIGSTDFIRNGPSWRAAATIGVGDLSDIEGGAARAWGVATELGGTLDRLSDKISMLPVELALWRRGRLSLGDLALRVVRDVAVNSVRGNVSKDPSSKSTNFNRASTAFRMFANDLSIAPLNRGPTSSLHHASTALVIASGVRSIIKARRRK